MQLVVVQDGGSAGRVGGVGGGTDLGAVLGLGGVKEGSDPGGVLAVGGRWGKGRDEGSTQVVVRMRGMDGFAWSWWKLFIPVH